ncbi:MAG: prenyltransferase [Candidatus Gastranaerophilaceae bacterium]
MLKEFLLWSNAARSYSFPMSIMSWSVPFLFAILSGGNVFYGIIALTGIIFAHAGVNLFDDYIDFKLAAKSNPLDKNYNLQKGKCSYILNGSATLNQLFSVTCFCFGIALACGIFLTLKTGIIVIYLTVVTAVICIFYPVLSLVALGEAAVAITFAPLLYTGVYYVMTMSFSRELIPIAVSTGLLTVSLLHAHMFLDIDFDKINRKNTLCRLAGSKANAVNNQLIIMLAAYLNIILLCIFGFLSKIYLITFASLPTAIVLYKTMKDYIVEPNKKIRPNVFFGFLENLQKYKQTNNINFMIIFLTARNVMVEFTALICIAKILRELPNVHF